jgi:hypothetical protein
MSKYAVVEFDRNNVTNSTLVVVQANNSVDAFMQVYPNGVQNMHVGDDDFGVPIVVVKTGDKLEPSCKSTFVVYEENHIAGIDFDDVSYFVVRLAE